ncbi:hypothetical protein CFP56_019469 [Quercus suber]|uniref:Uncharacterized protein n=1 Tax=Quercus suber TaxID=58331 RepID=A0AAW0KKQ5_QUESU
MASKSNNRAIFAQRFLSRGFIDAMQNTRWKTCETQCRPQGSESLPKGIVSKTSDLEMRSLWGPLDKKKSKSSMNLLAIAAGIKQKESVNKIVKKFLSSDFVVMLFHYDGIVDDWRDLDWSDHAIHVSAINQTKWWFAKRFLHPDIVSEYAYIFLWDEDLGIENFNVGRYLKIIKEEGFEISQPALDPNISEVHHHLTARDSRSKVHRWVEMMAPVFSRASWHCAWHMIQGDRTKNIGIVDSEYIIHYGLPTLGGSVANKTEEPNQAAHDMSSHSSEKSEGSLSHQSDGRTGVRKRSFVELEIFKNRWKKAVKEDYCWIDPYQKPPQQGKS